MKKKLSIIDMVREFQCPGCTVGINPEECPKYKLDQSFGATCSNHRAGTRLMPGGKIALGLPKGFNRYGIFPEKSGFSNHIDGYMTIRLWDEGAPNFDNYNVAVWKMEQDGFVFVRTFSPRVNHSCVDVIQMNDLTLEEIAPGAINVAPFHDDMD